MLRQECHDRTKGPLPEHELGWERSRAVQRRRRKSLLLRASAKELTQQGRLPCAWAAHQGRFCEPLIAPRKRSEAVTHLLRVCIPRLNLAIKNFDDLRLETSRRL